MATATTPVIAGNWKMHMGPEAARKFCREFAQVVPPTGDRTILLFPPALSLGAVRDGRGGVASGAEGSVKRVIR